MAFWGTFPNQRADPEELARQVEVLAPGTRVVTLKPGESYLYRRWK